jgi:protein-tyrosine phosphatase
MIRSDIYWIKECPVGRLAILARPRSGDWLGDEVGSWKQAGFDLIVSVLEDVEVSELGLELELEECRNAGLEFHRFPIADRGIPASPTEVNRAVSIIVNELRSNHGVGIHCRMGIGRSGLISACVLSVLGMTPEKAWYSVERARGRPVPDTQEQRDWLTEWSERAH